MKVAILVSGQPRNFHKGFLALKKAYLNRYECDIYYHTWDANIFQATQFFSNRPSNVYEYDSDWHSRLNQIYNPKNYILEPPKIFDDKNIVDPVWRQPLQNTKSMFYSMKQVFDLTPTGYDCYIRTRFDLIYEEDTLDLEKLDLSKLHVWEWDTDIRVRHRGIYDVFAVGNYENIGMYSNVYPRLDWYLNYDQNYSNYLDGDSKLRNEYLLKWHLLQSGVSIETHSTHIPHADGQIIR
jgi:hypothetical protein